ncbi:PREDICTED: dihydroxyacetone phosphate acyltransferase-like isoform X2 [Priapulus caudatus]|nr:PREDICTED: dihydroxyacetone phosphate acyltransferase-like isoform X2 [Priapulus caudatus]XP_014682045.1 PREDICTED: dihydroxyacetone phosphate acyltransferase-like isoform X2 [Priapulus caudatus]XP_014682046.1 PREDICTED: dihydroxyacetone phosphate acyltransferase-like isoform X2 [Priapulus caudatus]
MIRCNHGFEEIIHHSGCHNVAWGFNSYNPPVYKYNNPRQPSEIRSDVIQSDRVCRTIAQLSEREGKSETELRQEAEEIISEMGHEKGMAAIRVFAIALTNTWRHMYRGIYVNKGNILKVRELCKDHPVVFMPCHRSYMDFLLMSYICYAYDLPCPVITAGMDFMAMQVIGSLLRRSGAFFIRRSFGSDLLYWAIFTEYVQTHLRNGDSPVEFFVEGTRSRSQKSLAPKLGCLTAVLETYFKAEVPDLYIVPVGISYERILEEKLYSYELLGVPKPRESTSGLWKARHILSSDYGSIHVSFATPISVHEFMKGHVDRSVHSVQPRYMSALSQREIAAAQIMAEEVLLQQQRQMVLSPWSLVATLLLHHGGCIHMKQLCTEVQWLKQLAENFGSRVDWHGAEDGSVEKMLRDILPVYKDTVTLSTDLHLRSNPVEKATSDRKGLDSATMATAVQHMMLAIYRNQLLHAFLHTGLISVAVIGCRKNVLCTEELYDRHLFLQKLLCKEFTFSSTNKKKEFDHAFLCLQHIGAVSLSDHQLHIARSTTKTTIFLQRLFQPFLFGYWLLFEYLVTHGVESGSSGQAMAIGAQTLGAHLLQQGILSHPEILSLEMLSNGVKSLLECGAICRQRNRTGDMMLVPDRTEIFHLKNELGKVIQLPVLDAKGLALPLTPAKL